MNTLTISIGLLVLVTLLALAIHSGWQSYRGHRQRKAKADSADATSSQAGAVAAGQPGVSHDRSEPSLDSVLAKEADSDDLSDLNDHLIAQEHAAAERSGARAEERDFTIDAAQPSPVVEALLPEVPVGAEHDAPAPVMAAAAPGTPEAVRETPAAALDAEKTAQSRIAVQPSSLSERVDCLVEFALESPVSGQRLLHATQTIRRFGSKAAGFDGMAAPDRQRPVEAGLAAQQDEPVLDRDRADQHVPHSADSPAWQMINPAQFYQRFRMGVLLANRHGALNPMEFAEFADTANKLATHFGALAVIPDMTKTLEYARQLDAECIKLDAQLGLNIDCPSAPSAADLARVARDQGLTERGSNRYARLGRHEELLFTLTTSDRPTRLTLLLDVPRAPIEQQPWPALLGCAHETMTALKGQLVDDSGRPLNTRNLDSLSAELAQRYAMLDQSGFKAGSALATRVFN